MSDPQDDGRMDYEAAAAYVSRGGGAAFAVTPVFEEDQESAAGARVFVLVQDPQGFALRFVAGPFFSAAFAANERIASRDVPESVKAMRFLPTRVEEDWFGAQVQILIQKLMKAAGQAAPQMPDYEKGPSYRADAEVVFPLAHIGRVQRH